VRQEPDELLVISICHCITNITRLKWPKDKPFCSEFDAPFHAISLEYSLLDLYRAKRWTPIGHNAAAKIPGLKVAAVHIY
jgi:hypothetical protein